MGSRGGPSATDLADVVRRLREQGRRGEALVVARRAEKAQASLLEGFRADLEAAGIEAEIRATPEARLLVGIHVLPDGECRLLDQRSRRHQ